VLSSAFRATHVIPTRILRLAASKLGPTRFHYTRLNPNYETYWTADSDAVNSMDRFEAALWFISRGDECLNCGSLARNTFTRARENWLEIKVATEQ